MLHAAVKPCLDTECLREIGARPFFSRTTDTLASVPEPESAPQVNLTQLSALDLDMAPDSPGIYAWYSQLPLSEGDWKPQMREERDLAVGYFTKAVSDYARVHQQMPINLKGEGSYSLHWSGTIRRASIADPVSGIEENPLFLSHIADLAAEPEVRQLLIGLLRAATPTFASPLYIGVATNLRTRLSEHRTAYETARANLRLKPSAASHMQFEGESFGERLAGAGMQLEHLQCWMLQVDFVATFFQSSRETMTARQIAESAEWVLQRIFFQPVLGRK